MSCLRAFSVVMAWQLMTEWVVGLIFFHFFTSLITPSFAILELIEFYHTYLYQGATHGNR